MNLKTLCKIKSTKEIILPFQKVMNIIKIYHTEEEHTQTRLNCDEQTDLQKRYHIKADHRSNKDKQWAPTYA